MFSKVAAVTLDPPPHEGLRKHNAVLAGIFPRTIPGWIDPDCVRDQVDKITMDDMPWSFRRCYGEQK